MGIDESYEQCAQLANLDLSLVGSCAKNAEMVWTLQHNAARMMPRYADFLPWVEVNGELVNVLNGESLWDAVCDAIGAPSPGDSDTDDPDVEPNPYCFNNGGDAMMMIGKNAREHKGEPVRLWYEKERGSSISNTTRYNNMDEKGNELVSV